jgi:hypothetical protein
MPNDLRIQAAPSVNVGSEWTGSVQTPATESGAVGHATPAASPTPNPTLELDTALGLVVIQFHNDSGTVTNSIPTQQQLDAYRLWQETHVGPPPNIGIAVATADASPAATHVASASPPAPTAPTAAVKTEPAQSGGVDRSSGPDKGGL